jgi:hypothetical protein
LVVCSPFSRVAVVVCFRPIYFFRDPLGNVARPRQKRLEGGGGFHPCFDLFMPEEVVIAPGEEVLVDTKIQLRFAPGTCGMLGVRRSVDRRHRLRLSNSVIGERWGPCLIKATTSNLVPFAHRSFVQGHCEGDGDQPGKD